MQGRLVEGALFGALPVDVREALDSRLAIGPTKTGVSRLAVGAGVPVVSAALSGTERVFPAQVMEEVRALMVG